MTTKGRPQYTPINWASDAVIAGAAIGNGLAPTLRPSDGYIAQGFHPLAPVEPRKMNYVLRDGVLRDAYLDLVDAQNWIESSNSIDISTGSGNAIRGACALTWHSSRRLIAVGNGEDALESWDGGCTWDVAFTVAGGDLLDCCTREENAAAPTELASAVLLSTGAAVRISLRGTSGGAWTQTTITNADVAMVGSGLDHGRVIPDPYVGGFWVGGQTTARAAVWRITDTNGVYSAQTQLEYAPLAASNITLMAKNPTHGIAAAWDGAAGRLYRWANADTALAAVTHPDAGTGRIIDLLWDATNSVFLLFCDNGSGLIKLYRSATGATGSWTVQSMGAANGQAGVRGAGCVRGSVVMLPVFDATPTPDRYWIVYSGDAGLTWEFQPNPLRRFGSGATGWYKVDRLRVLDRRFGTFSYSASGIVLAAYSMRTGRELSRI